MLASVCEAYHYTPAQVGELTLYQLHVLALGVEGLKKAADRRAWAALDPVKREILARAVAQSIGGKHGKQTA